MSGGRARKPADRPGAPRLALSIGAAFAPVQELALRCDIERLFGRYLSESLTQISVTQMLDEIVALLFNHGIRLPSELTMAMKAMVQVEEVAHLLDPHIQISDIARKAIQQLFWQRLNPDTDFSAPLTKIQGLDPQPDAIVISPLLGPAAKIIVKARELGLNQQIIGGNGFNAPLIIKATAGKAEGAIFGAAWSCSNSFPANVNFINAYIAKWGEAPDQFAAQSATALQLLAVVMQEGKTTTDPMLLRDALATVKDVDTPLGKFTFTADRNAQQETFVQTIKGGQFVLLEIVK